MEREYTSTLDPLVTSNGVRCLKGEIHRVIASLRGNARFSSTARFTREIPLHAENPLLRALKTLLIKLESSDDLLEIDTVAYLRPFLDIIVTPETSSHITTAALTSLNKFLLYGFLHPEAPRITEAINKLAYATNLCKFEPISTKDAESTLMTLLEVLENIIRCPAGPLLTDENVWSLLHCSHTLSKIEKSSLLLRKTAEATLTHIVLHVFSNGRRIASRHRLQETSQLASPHSSMVAGHSHALQPYGEPVLTRILSWLSSALGDGDAQRDTIILALEMINSILETGGPVLGRFASVVYVCQAELCKFLIPVSRSSDPVVLALALRVVFNLFVSMKQHLKVQLEVFFSSVHLYLADNNNSVSAFQRELALESLLEFCREPTLLFDFYVNYDCDVACANLFENLVRLLSAAAVPGMNSRLTTLNTVALDGLFAILAFLMSKLRSNLDLHSASTPAFTEFEETQPDEGLLQKKLLKKKYSLAAHRFNTDPKHWIQFVQELGLLPSPADPQSVAHFLRNCPGLDKSMVGAYLSEMDDQKHSFQTSVRQSFVQLFDFTDLRIDEALRVFLESFRLPGEAQKIERLMESFAALVWKQSRGPMTHADAPFVLAYSIIMLNTDLHNKTVKKKMTEEQFVNNNRGIDGGSDLPKDYLSEIYRSILAREIILRADAAAFAATAAETVEDKSPLVAASPISKHIDVATIKEDLEGTLAAAVGTHWEGVMRRQNAVSAYTSMSLTHQRDASHAITEMCTILLDPMVQTLASYVELTADIAIVRKVLRSLQDCAELCRKLHRADQANRIVILLCRMATNDLEGLTDSVHDSSSLQFAEVIVKRFLGQFGKVTDELVRQSLFDEDVAFSNRASETTHAHASFQARDVDSDTSEDDVHVVRSTKLRKNGCQRPTTGNEYPAARAADLTPKSVGAFRFRRGMLACRAVFRVAQEVQSLLKDSWKNVVELLNYFSCMDAFPTGVVDLDDIRSPSGLPISSVLDLASDANNTLHDPVLQPLSHVREMLGGSQRVKRLLDRYRRASDETNRDVEADSIVYSDDESTPGNSYVGAARRVQRAESEILSARSSSPPLNAGRSASTGTLLDSIVSMFAAEETDERLLDEHSMDMIWTAVAADICRTGLVRLVVAGTKTADLASVIEFCKALLLSIQAPHDHAPVMGQVTAPTELHGMTLRLLCQCSAVEILAEICTINVHRVHHLLSVVFAGVHTIGSLRNAPATSSLVGEGADPHNVLAIALQSTQYLEERCVLALLRIAIRVMAVEGDCAQPQASPISCAAQILHHMSELPDQMISDHCARITSGMAILLRVGPARVHAGISADEAAITHFFDSFFACMRRCKPFFYAGAGLWDMMCVLVTDQLSVRLSDCMDAAALHRLHKHLYAHTLNELSTYFHLATTDASIAGIAASILMVDADERVALQAELRQASPNGDGPVPPGKSNTFFPTEKPSARKPLAFGALKRRILDGCETSKMRGIGSSDAPLPSSVLPLGRSYRSELRLMVENEPLSDLREFVVQAVLRLVEQISHNACPTLSHNEGLPIHSETAAVIDECWLMVLNLLRACIIHVSRFPIGGGDADLPQLDPLMQKGGPDLEFAGLTRIRPHLVRAAIATLQRVLITSSTTQGGFHAIPINATAWLSAWSDALLPIAREISAPPQLHHFTLEGASHVISSYNICTKALVQALHSGCPVGILQSSWLTFVALISDTLHRCTVDVDTSESENAMALQTVQDAIPENLRNTLSLLLEEFPNSPAVLELWLQTQQLLQVLPDVVALGTVPRDAEKGPAVYTTPQKPSSRSDGAAAFLVPSTDESLLSLPPENIASSLSVTKVPSSTNLSSGTIGPAAREAADTVINEHIKDLTTQRQHDEEEAAPAPAPPNLEGTEDTSDVDSMNARLIVETCGQQEVPSSVGHGEVPSASTVQTDGTDPIAPLDPAPVDSIGQAGPDDAASASSPRPEASTDKVTQHTVHPSGFFSSFFSIMVGDEEQD